MPIFAPIDDVVLLEFLVDLALNREDVLINGNVELMRLDSRDGGANHKIVVALENVYRQAPALRQRASALHRGSEIAEGPVHHVRVLLEVFRPIQLRRWSEHD